MENVDILYDFMGSEILSHAQWVSVGHSVVKEV